MIRLDTLSCGKVVWQAKVKAMRLLWQVGQRTYIRVVLSFPPKWAKRGLLTGFYDAEQCQ